MENDLRLADVVLRPECRVPEPEGARMGRVSEETGTTGVDLGGALGAHG